MGISLLLIGIVLSPGKKILRYEKIARHELAQVEKKQANPRSLPERGDERLLLGASLSLTGKYSSEGKRLREGYELWRELVNSQGGINVAGRRYLVRIQYYDDASKKSKLRRNIRRLIDKDRVDFLLGPFSSGFTLAAAEIAREHRVILLNTAGASEAIFSKYRRYTVGVLTSASWFTKDFFAMVAQTVKPKPRTYAILVVDKLFAKSVARGARIWAAFHSMKLVYQGLIPVRQKDYSPYINKALARRPEVLIFSGHYRESLRFARQLPLVYGYNLQAVASTFGPTQRSFVAEMGRKAEGMVGMSQWSVLSGYHGPIFGSSQDYAKTFRARWGGTPSYQNAQASAAGVALQIALRQSPRLEARVVLQKLRNLDIETFYGHIRFDEHGFNVGHKMAVVQIQQGQRLLVWPGKSKQADFVYPFRDMDNHE